MVVRVLLLFLIAALAPMTIGMLRIRADLVAAEARALENARSVARAAALDVETLLQTAQGSARIAERLPDFWSGSDEDRDRILNAFVASQPAFNAVLFFTGDYRERGRSGYQAGTERLDVSGRAYARRAVATGRMALTPAALRGMTNGTTVLPVAVPVREQQSPYRGGFLTFGLKVDALPSVWEDVLLPGGSSVMLVDLAEGRILAGSDSVRPRVDEVIAESSLRKIRGGAFAFRTGPESGPDRLRGWETVGDTPWIVLADTPSAAILPPIYDQALRRAAEEAAVAAVTLLLLVLVWRGFARRLGTLQAAAVRWTRGEWLHRTSIAGTDELGLLGTAFDGMAARLQDTMGLLQADIARRTRTESALRDSEERYRSVLSAMGDGVMLRYADGSVGAHNPRVERILGITAAQMAGSAPRPPAWSLVRQDGSPCGPHDDLIATTQRTGQDQTDKVFGVHRPDGTFAWVSVTTRPLVRPGEDAPYAVVASFTDVTERLTIERLKDGFISTVSHELRTPLNGVIGMTELLLATPLEPRQREFAESAQQSGEALLQIVNDILDFSKIDAGALALERADLDVRAIAESVTRMLSEQAQRKGLEITCAVRGATPDGLQGDPVRLRQVLTNLAANAVKFTPQGEVEIRVDIGPTSVDETVAVRFEVRDTGIGIPPDVLGRLFRPFTQADSSTAREFGGTGLGLAISKRLVELMGGEIGVQSMPGRGSTFWCTVPLHRSAAASSAGTEPHAILRGLRVLVVDDNETNRVILAELAAGWGMQPDPAEGGARALSLLEEAAAARAAYDVALLDIHMPSMDGLTLARAMQADPRFAATRIVLLTSLGCAEAPADLAVSAWLTKPVRHADLLGVLTRVMREAPGQRGLPRLAEHADPPDAAALRALVVEDSLINQRVATGMLRRLGYHAEVAASGREALQRLSAGGAYDVVLMDCQMPEMDGLEATAAIRHAEAREGRVRTPIVAMTAHAVRDARERCLAAGMDGYLAKPVRLETLRATLEGLSLRAATASASGKGAAEMVVLDPGAIENLRSLQGPGEEDLLDTLASQFLAEAPRRLDAMRAAAAEGDGEALWRLAHTLKGEASAFGAGILQTGCLELEQRGRDGRLDGATVLVEQVAEALQRVAAALEQACQAAARPAVAGA